MTVFAIVFCMYSVAWHRLYLVPEEQASAGAAYRWGGRQWRFLFNYVKVFLVMIPPFIVAEIVILGIAVAAAAAFIISQILLGLSLDGSTPDSPCFSHRRPLTRT